jgi:thioredoxin
MKMMTRFGLILTTAALMAASCGNGKARTDEGHKATVTEVAVGSEAGAAAAAGSGLEAGSTLSEGRASAGVTGEGASAAAGVASEGLMTDAGIEMGIPEGMNDDQQEAKGGTQLLTKADFLKMVWNYEKSPKEWVFLGNKPAIIDFYADWCGPCKIASPILEEVSHEFAGKIDVYKIDTQKEQELAAVFGVRSIPAFLYIPRSGKPTMMAGIARTKEDTKKMFVDNINTLLLQTK